MLTSDFVIATASNLIATVLGVAIGVPAALHVNGRSLAATARRDVLARIDRVDASIQLLLDSCAYNAGVLSRIEELALTGHILRNPDLRLTTWDVVTGGLNDFALKPSVLQVASHHWLRLKRFDDLNTEMYGREILGEAGWPDDDRRSATWAEFYQMARTLVLHCAEILNALGDERLRLSQISGPSSLACRR